MPVLILVLFIVQTLPKTMANYSPLSVSQDPPLQNERYVTASSASFKSLPTKRRQSTESLLSLLHVGATLVYRESGASLSTNQVLTSRQRESQQRNVSQEQTPGSVFKKTMLKHPGTSESCCINTLPKFLLISFTTHFLH